MTEISDNSGNSNRLILNGNSTKLEDVYEKEFKLKSVIQPTGTNALRGADNFGTIIATNGDTVVVGTPNHPYDANGAGTLTNAGTVWVYNREIKIREKDRFKKVKQSQVFSATGADQIFKVPDNVTEVTVHLWGAGGGGEFNGIHKGGNGGYTKATFLVSAGKTYKIVVGKGGVLGGLTPAYGDGGYLTAADGKGGSGGGRTAFADFQLGDMIVAGGGGGAGLDGNGGSAGGLVGLPGTTQVLESYPQVTTMAALGGDRGIPGLNDSYRFSNFGLEGISVDPYTSIANNTLTLLRDKGLGGNASPSSQPNFTFGNGAGGGGWAGGGAGPSAYRYRGLPGLEYGPFFEIHGSGAGGCGNISLTPGFIPYNTEKKIITNALMLSGDELNFGDNITSYGQGGQGSTPGGDGHVLVEWVESVLEDDIDTIWKWNQTGRLVSDVRSTSALMGSAVAITEDGVWLFAGAPGVTTDSSNLDSKTGAGAVYVFRKINNAWQQVQKIVATGTNARNANDNFGASVAYADGGLYIGAPRHAYNSAGTGSVTNAGAVFAYALVGNSWVLQSKISAQGSNSRASGDNFGYKISTSQGRVAIASKNGYPLSGSVATTAAGNVFVYEYENNALVQKARFVGPRTANALFGSALHLKGNTLTVEGTGATSRWIYERENGVWGLSVENPESKHDFLMQALTGWQPGGSSAIGFSQSGYHGMTYGGDSTFIETDDTLDLIGDSAALGVRNIRGFVYYNSATTFTNRQQWSMEYWVHPNTISTSTGSEERQVIISRANAFGVYAKVTNVSAGVGDVILQLFDQTGARVEFSAGTLAMKKWSHFAFVRDGNEIRTYLGGELVNTYDVTGKSFKDSTSPIYFGFNNAYEPGVMALLYTGRFFGVRSTAAYKGSFVPSTYMVKALNPDEAGRGTTTYILDSSTILSGLPQGNQYDPVMYDSSSLRDKETYRLEQNQNNIGMIDVITKLENDKWSKVQSELVPPGLVNKRQATGFGASIAVDDDYVVVSSINDTMGVNGNRKNTQATGSAWVFDIKDDFDYVRKITSNTRSRSGTANGFGRASAIASNGNIYISENNFTDIAKVHVNFSYFSNGSYRNTKQVWNFTSSGRVSMLTHREDSIDLTGEIVMDNRAYAAYVAHSDSSAAWPTTNPAYVYSRTLTDRITVDGDNEVFVSDINGTNPNPIWGDRTNYGSVARLKLDSTYTYVFDEMQVPGVATGDSRSAYAFGYRVKVVGDQVLIGAPRSRFNGATLTAPVNAGNILSYKYSEKGQGWDLYRSYFAPTPLANNNYGLAFDYNNYKLISRSGSTTANVYAQVLDENDNIITSQTLSAAGTNTTDNASLSATFVKDDEIFAVGSPNFQSGFRANVGTIEAFNNDGNDVFAKSVQDLDLKTTIPYRTTAEQFGYSIAMQGTKMLVGIPGLRTAPDGSVQRSGNIGGAKVYDFVSDRWERVDTLYDTAETNARRFGETVSWTPTKAVLRAVAGTTGYNKVFDYDNSAWVFKATVSATTSANSVAIVSDNLLVQGLSTTSPNTGSLVNSAGSFRNLTSADSTTWTPGSNVFVPLTTNGAYEQDGIAYGSVLNLYAARNAGDRFGYSMAMSPDAKHLMIGAPNHNYQEDPNATATVNSGAVFAYYWDALTGQWRLNAKLKATGPTANHYYGLNITNGDENEFIVRKQGTSNRGDITKVTRLTDTDRTATWANTWTVAAATAVNSENYGTDVAWDSTRDLFYVGVPNRTQSSVASGAFETITDSATPTRQSFQFDGFTVRNRNTFDYFGRSVSIFNGHLAVGTSGYLYNNDGTQSGGRGAVFTYKLNDEFRFDYESKITFEGYTGSQYGLWVGINDTTLATYGTSHIPDVRVWENNAWTTQTVTPNASVSSTPYAYGWDPLSGNIMSVSRTATTNMAIYTSALGGAIPVDYNGSTWAVAATGVVTRSVLSGGQLINSPRLDISALGFGTSGTALSPDGSMVAITASGDDVFENDASYIQAGQRVLSKVYVFKRDDNDKFIYHSMIVAPNAKTGFGSTMSWTDEGLFIQQAGFLTFLFKLHDDNYRWYVERSFQMESGTGSTMVATDNGLNLVLAKPTSTGYPHLTNSGALHTMAKINGFWGSNRGTHAGADADITASTGVVGGGGGAGLRGGAAGASTNATVMGGAWGGSNLVLAGGTQLIAQGASRANAENVNALGAGGQLPGNDGEHARIIITANGVPTIFDYTGADQQFVVPEGTTSVDVEMWGAGGGAGFLVNVGYRRASRGGAGSYVSGSLTVVPGETLTVMVGGGGIAGVSNSTPSSRRQSRRYGLGGMGFTPLTANNTGSGSGGGLAGIKRNDEFLTIAAGGGGGTTRTSDSAAYNLDGMPGGLSNPEESSNMLAQSSDYNLIIAPGAANSRNTGDFAGHSVGIIDDNNILAGSPGHRYTYEGEILPLNSGAIFQYKRINGKWDISDKITSLDSRTGEYFGSNMELRDGKLVVVGSIPSAMRPLSNELSFTLPSSTLELMEFNGAQFTNLAKRVLTDEDTRGLRATIVGDQVVLGNPLRDKNETSTTVTNAGGFTSYDNKLVPTNVVVGIGVSHGRFAEDLFGSGVAITANQIIVGAPGHGYTTNGASFRSNQGALFVFDKKGSRYAFKTKDNLTNTPQQTLFGSSLTLIGDKLYAGTAETANVVELTNNMGTWTKSKVIIGTAGLPTEIINSSKMIQLNPASGVGTNGQPTIDGAGFAGTFAIDGSGVITDMNQNYTIPGNSNGRNANDHFGTSVYANHDFVVVGAPGVTTDIIGNPMTHAGALFVFNKNGTAWEREIKLVAEEGAASGYGLTIAGSSGWITTAGPQLGNARVFQRTAEGIWVVRQDLVGDSAEKFGASIAMADTAKFVVGIPLADGRPTDIPNLTDSGLVQTWTRQSSTFTDRGYLSARGLSNGRNQGDWFGHTIASNKDFVVVGSPKHSYDALGNSELNDAGAVWIYLRSEGKYPLIGKYVPATRTADGLFGWTVAINTNSNHIAIGEPGTRSVHVYDFDGDKLTFMQTFTSTEENFGSTLAMGSGKLAIGSPTANGHGKVDVYVLDASVGTWELSETIEGFTDDQGIPMANGSVADDLFGSAIALDSNNSIIVGAPGHDYNRVGADPISNAGAVFLKKV